MNGAGQGHLQIECEEQRVCALWKVRRVEVALIRIPLLSMTKKYMSLQAVRMS